MSRTEIRAYAKVNFILNILGTRPDGFHEIESVMQAVSLCDDVALSWTPEGDGLSIELHPGRDDLPCDDGNLAYRAALAMHRRFHPDRSESMRIDVVKRIPVAAGLAGGSADAAAVINALAELWDIGDEAALCETAAQLGSDIPFCLMAQRGKTAAIATGRGTELEFIPPTKFSLLLTTPEIAVPTRAVYAELRPEDCTLRCDVSAFRGDLSPERKLASMGNHLQAPALRLFPSIADVLALHASLDGMRHTQLSGSGPTVFSVLGTRTDEEASPDLHGIVTAAI